MKLFLKKVGLIIVLPLLLYSCLLIYLDPFKVFWCYENYYKDYAVTLNKDFITTEMYIKNRNNKLYDSFIFGSSRSQAFKCLDWKSYLPSKAHLFHFDAGSEGIFGIANKIKLIDSMGDTIKNALVVLDEECLSIVSNRNSHLYISHPEVSKESKFVFYNVFFSTSFNAKFITAFIDFKVNKVHRDYMGWYISKFVPRADVVSGDVWYANYDDAIKSDSVVYYRDLVARNVFYKRPAKKEKTPKVKPKEISLLREIKAIFDKQQTRYKIIISPLYDQIPLDTNRVNNLVEIFGAPNVYNFSGINHMTEKIGNYYEASHYRPHVARAIMKEIYSSQE